MWLPFAQREIKRYMVALSVGVLSSCTCDWSSKMDVSLIESVAGLDARASLSCCRVTRRPWSVFCNRSILLSMSLLRCIHLRYFRASLEAMNSFPHQLFTSYDDCGHRINLCLCIELLLSIVSYHDVTIYSDSWQICVVIQCVVYSGKSHPTTWGVAAPQAL